MFSSRHILLVFCFIFLSLTAFQTSEAQRASLGKVGAGGARPSAGAMNRGGIQAARPQINRPQVSPGNMGRPALGQQRPNFQRPQMQLPQQRPQQLPGQAARPGGGGAGWNFNPSGTGNRPALPGGINRPAVQPGMQLPGNRLPGNNAGRPSINLPAQFPPATRPSFPGGNSNRPGNLRPPTGSARPATPGIQLPGQTRPTPLPGQTRPTLPGQNRPSRLPGNNRPGDLTRPAVPPVGIDRPSVGGVQRPVTLPGDVRPGTGWRPGGVTRPVTPTLPARPPVIGGNRPNINAPGGVVIGGNNNNVIINNNHWNINNGNQWGYPRHGGWGNNGGGWNRPGVSTLPACGDYWYHNHIHDHHHGWYHGCWNGNWNSYWYSPATIAVTGWGLGYAYSGYSSWQTGWVNPYYVATPQPIYDYSQPVNLRRAEAQANAEAVSAEHDRQRALAEFDEAIAFFQSRDYRKALQRCEGSLRVLGDDPVLHEFRALCLFALGDYRPAAATLNSLLANAPGMDWTSMSQLYADTAEYTKHLGALEKHVARKPSDSAAQFLLAYHYLVVGEDASAVAALQQVVASEPTDRTAQRMLEALVAEQPAAAAPAANPAPAAQPAPSPAQPAPAADPAVAATPELNLAGRWVAEPEGATIELVIDDQSGFTWKVQPAEGEGVTVSGQVVATSDTLVLDGGERGTMVAKVKPLTADQFQFVFTGGPPEDEGLVFERAER